MAALSDNHVPRRRPPPVHYLEQHFGNMGVGRMNTNPLRRSIWRTLTLHGEPSHREVRRWGIQRDNAVQHSVYLDKFGTSYTLMLGR